MLILLMKTGNKTARNRVFYFNLSFCYNLQLKMLFLRFFNLRLSIVNRVLDWHLSSMSEPVSLIKKFDFEHNHR